MRLTHEQMLALWRRLRGYEPERSDCSVEIFEGIDRTAVMSSRMRSWYLNLLDTADAQFLKPADIAAKLKWTRTAPGVWTAGVPADVRRVLSVTPAGTYAPVAVTSPGGNPRAEALSANPYGRGSCRPLCAFDGRTLALYTSPEVTAMPVEVMAVQDPGDEFYEFDESALSLITPEF